MTVMTKGMSRFPNNYVSTYILHNATLLYVKRGMQEYFVTTLIAAYASFFFLRLLHHSNSFEATFSFFFFPTVYLEKKRKKLQVIEIKRIHIFLHFSDDWT